MPRRIALFLAALLAFTGCDQVTDVVDPPARTEDAAVAFAEAWSGLDAEAMSSALTNPDRCRASRVAALLGRAVPGEVIDTVQVRVDEAVEQPSADGLTDEAGPQPTTSA